MPTRLAPDRLARMTAALAALVGICLVAAPSVGAQDFGQFDNPTGVAYTEYAWPLCVIPPDPANGFVQPGCLGDATEETTSRTEIRTEDRWLRAGVLMGAQIWAGVEYLRDILHGARSVIGLVESIVHGRPTGVTNAVALRFSDAGDTTGGVGSRIARTATVATSIPYAIDQGRFATLEAIVIRGLAVARDAQAAAASLGDQSAAVQARLSPGPVTVLPIGAGPVGALGGVLPPLAADAGAGALNPYATLPHPPAPSTNLSVPLTDDDAPDPQVVYERATVMSKGAQMAATGTLADVRTTRQEIAAVEAREAAYEREAAWSDVVRSVSHF